MEDEPLYGRPASVGTATSVDRVRPFIRQDRRLAVRMIVDELDINECTVYQIVTARFEYEEIVCGDDCEISE